MNETIIRAADVADIAAARALFLEYEKSLGIDLAFQDFAHELADLPGEYSPPSGSLLLAVGDGIATGCVAVRSFDGLNVAELKRLYVRPSARGRGLGLRLADSAIAAAREVGYKAIRLDTLPTMTSAQALYRRLGFREIDPYRFNPIPSTSYWELRL